MKKVNILIPNFNAWGMIKLCIESIIRFTEYPSYKITVYDDGSYNDEDIYYLRSAKAKGAINLIEGEKRLGHGNAINVLLDTCKTSVALIMDNDVQILEGGWLSETVDALGSNIGVFGIERGYRSAQPSLPDWFQSWFMCLNMTAYRKRLKSDWRHKRIEYEGREVYCPVGGEFWLKLKEKGLEDKIVPVPESVKRKFRHWEHISVIATPDYEHDAKNTILIREKKMAAIREELYKLRA